MKIFLIILSTLVYNFCYTQNILHGVIFDSLEKVNIKYATILVNDKIILTNNEGIFQINSSDIIQKIVVKALGYYTDTFYINKTNQSDIYYLRKRKNSIKDVEIKSEDHNERFVLFVNAVNSLKRMSSTSIESKSFYRSYTTLNNGNPAEYFEGYFNVTTDLKGIHSPKLKAGRFLLPKKMTFLNFSPMLLIENFDPFNSDAYSVFPYTPFIFKDWGQLKQYYKIIIESKTPLSNGDTLLHFKFIARNTRKGFSGDFYYLSQTKTVDKIILTADSVHKIPFSTLADSSHDKIQNLGYKIEIGFDNSDYVKFKYVDLDYQFDVLSSEKIMQINTSMKLILYDYGSRFQTPICRSIIGLSDYQKVAYYPYNSYFFERNQVLLENKNERQIKKTFENIDCYDSKLKNYHSIPFLKHNVIEWTKNWELDLKYIPDKNNKEAHYRLKYYENEVKKKEWDSSFASTILFLDYDCYPDTVVFYSNALLDYSYSYMLEKKESDIIYFKHYLNLSKIASNMLLWNLRKEFNTKNCPKEKKVLKIYDKINMGMEQDIYGIYANSNSRFKMFFLNIVDSLIKRNLLISEKKLTKF